MRAFLMRKLFAVSLTGLLWLGMMPSAAASLIPNQSTHLVPCDQSPAFIERMQAAPQTYYFDTPYQSYAAHEFCGAEGMPHLQLRFDRAMDVISLRPFLLHYRLHWLVRTGVFNRQ